MSVEAGPRGAVLVRFDGRLLAMDSAGARGLANVLTLRLCSDAPEDKSAVRGAEAALAYLVTELERVAAEVQPFGESAAKEGRAFNRNTGEMDATTYPRPEEFDPPDMPMSGVLWGAGHE